MKIVALLLVKQDSTRLPNKNTLDFNGKPMYFWNLHKCAAIFDDVYVSSDSYNILSQAVREGAKPIHRTKELCGDCPDIPVFQHALSKMESDVDCIVVVHVDTPLIEANLIALTKKMMETGVQEIMTCKPMTYGSVYKSQHNDIGGSIRAMSRHRLENYLDPFQPNPDILLVDSSPEIETETDLKYALWYSNK